MENFNLKKYLAESKLLKENINNPLKPFFKGEELLSSPIISKDTKGRDIKLIGKEDEEFFWDNNGIRYSKINSNTYQPYMMDREDFIIYSQDRARKNHWLKNKYTPIKAIDEALSLDPSSPQISQYWDIMVKNQPEDVIKTLTDLTAGILPFEEFLSSTENDIYDSFRDDDMEDLDEGTLEGNSDVEAKFQNFVNQNYNEFSNLEDSEVIELSMAEAAEEGLDNEMINYLKTNYRFDYKDIVVYYNKDSNEIWIENNI